jgi:hypothetical protein
VPHPLWRIRIEQYHRMIQAGVLRADDPVELLEGLLAAKMHESRRLCGAGCLVGSALEAVVPAGWFVASAIPLRNRWLAPNAAYFGTIWGRFC